MITFVPLEYYQALYYYILLVFVMMVFAQSFNSQLTSSENLERKSFIGHLLMIFTILYMGMRPISFTFADMAVYAEDFESYRQGMPVRLEKDILFEYFMKICAQFVSAEVFFLICCVIYVVPMYLFSKKKFGEFWFYGFFVFILSFSFWAYGTNGIRNGIATSFFLLALSRDKKINIAGWMIIAIMFHQSLIIPTIAYVIALFYRNTTALLIGWVLAIALSLMLGTFWENLFLELGLIDEERVVGYLSGSSEYLDQVVEVQTGFRWDFLLYSASGIFAGWYYVVKRGFSDKFYHVLFSVYIIANALWILVIRANFSNRIAYLSWFLLGAVIIYPLLKNKFVGNQHRLVGGIIAVYFFFTFVINVIIA